MIRNFCRIFFSGFCFVSEKGKRKLLVENMKRKEVLEIWKEKKEWNNYLGVWERK